MEKWTLIDCDSRSSLLMLSVVISVLYTNASTAYTIIEPPEAHCTLLNPPIF
jgi:hypothetical protein